MPDAPPQPLLSARGASYYRITRFVIVVVLAGFGALCIKDGFFTYPRGNADFQDAQRAGDDHALRALVDQGFPHSFLDVAINRYLGVGLPPLAVAVLLWALHNSRGEYRLEQDVLSVPGHPPVPLRAVQRLDDRLWDSKGIAWVHYDLDGDGRSPARLKLDDFLYERDATEAIHDRIDAVLKSRG